MTQNGKAVNVETRKLVTVMIDRELWRSVKMLAIAQDRTSREVLESIVSRGLDKRAA